MNQDHEKYMQRCLELAAIAGNKGRTPVGSLIVQDGKIIAEGVEGSETLPPALAHAEVLAMVAAMQYTDSNDLGDCILYTTVEPCSMCSYLIRQTKIKEVVFGVRTKSGGGLSAASPVLTLADVQWQSPPLIVEGVLKEACGDLLAKKKK